MTLTLRYAARSDRGLIRSGNQDSVYAGPRLLAVADGMGGMAAGDVASNIVIATMAPLDEDVAGNAMIDTLRGAVDLANQQIRDAVEENPAMEGMGTTLTAMLFSGSKMGMVHIGDSRAYLVRDGEFAQVTKDDTYVQMLVDEGRISLEEANSHPQRSLLTRALDGRDADPEYSVRQVKPGDRYLLCSDGLSGVVSAETIASTLREYVDPNQCAARLIELALRGGGPDNITVIVADITDEDIVEARPIVGGAAAQDRGMATSADQSMSSARGAALAAPRPPVPEDEVPARAESRDDEEGRRRSRHPVRTTILLVVLLGLLGGALWYGWSYTQSRYFVGVTDSGRIAIFKGSPGNIAWLKLGEVYMESPTLTIDDLTPAAQSTVRQGITVDTLQQAQDKLNQLEKPDNPARKQACPTPQPSGSPSASLTVSASIDPTATATTPPVGDPAIPPSPTSEPASTATPTPTSGTSC
ncbi:protein phosphatase 2C domain-containing protein [Dactylosporangium matsuzakiense]|uniref:Serine/threonine protein phosphatase PstP n=1 Tax=Dactylosporangium matsuzakiense TaxID=53360 RepID=A0A9W6NIN3_9ACTN|nr:protein phosphatase 2C domain-containing protein [Dactylosporangium matsuzakiense]UWZ45054.1 protein phosphatase 2C domain-containing protein [Dactylosporangium matsuzakiense]GLK99019.1 protein phosphatase [Dactylosporangium matsuzakiense]